MKRPTQIIFLIFTIAAVLLFFKLNVNFNFQSELGDNLLDIKNTLNDKEIPLFGPVTSHPWLYFGPLYYWLLAPLMVLFSFNPLVAGYFGVVFGVVVVFINYFVVKRLLNEKTALVSSLLIAISPSWILFARNARFFFLTTIVFYPFVFSLFKFVKGETKYAFWVGLFYAIFFSFHYSPIILLPTLLFFLFINRKKIKIRDLTSGLLGIFIPFIPLLIFDSRNGFKMFVNLLTWVPYRIAGFVGLYPKNNLTYETLREGILSMNEFFGRLLIADSRFWPLISILALVAIAVYLMEIYKKGLEKSSFTAKFVVLGLVFGIFAIFVHGGVPVHYFLPLFPLASIFYAMIFISLCRKKPLKILISILFLIIFVYNLNWFLKDPLYYKKIDFLITDPHLVPYSLQLEASGTILADADGRPFSIKRIGPYDHFEENFSQNYRYLLWWKGNEPVEISDLVYTIVENSNKEADGVKIFSKGELSVYRK